MKYNTVFTPCVFGNLSFGGKMNHLPSRVDVLMTTIVEMILNETLNENPFTTAKPHWVLTGTDRDKNYYWGWPHKLFAEQDKRGDLV